jgi:hypothetical protein
MSEHTPLYWHFCQVGKKGTPHLGYKDNREVIVGETLRVEGDIELCHRGLHASTKLMDALGYVNSERLSLCRVTLGGTVKHDTDKSVASERTVIAMLDADTTEKLLRDFARWCALQVIHLWDAPDVVRQYLETGDESLRAATMDAAGAATWAAARYAAGDAFRYAAGAATWAATWAAARDAAWDATWDATWAAAGAAARYAARDAAWAAPRDAQNTELERRALVAMGIEETQP